MLPTLRHDPLPVSTAEPARFTPDHLAGDDPPVFLIRIPTIRDGITLDAAVAREGVRFPSDSEFATAIRNGIKEHVIDDEQPALLAVVQEWEDLLSERQEVPPELSEHIAQLQRVLRAHHRELSALEAERQEYFRIALLLRAQTYLMGIEGPDAPAVDRRAGRLTEASSQAIERKYGVGTLNAIGAHTALLTSPTEEQKGNSESPRPSPPARPTSKAANGRRMARNGKFSEEHSSATPD